MKRLVQWVLSKLFPYDGTIQLEECPESLRDWEYAKRRECEAFYLGTDRTGRW
jgi:hypothetical protein